MSSGRRFSVAMNTGRRPSNAGTLVTRRMRTGSATARRPVLHLRRASRGVFGALEHEEDTVLDPVEIKEEPTELITPMQIYPTTQGRYVWYTWDWIMTTLGYTFNVSTLLRSPFLAAKYGGTTFLLMYLLITILLAIPCCFLEAIVGQFTRSGSVVAWRKLCPLFKGLGFCFLLVNFFTTFFDNVMCAWALSYLVAIGRSIFGERDHYWTDCGNYWNSPSCIPFFSVLRKSASCNDSNSEYFRGFVLGQQDPSREFGFADMKFPGTQDALTLAGITIGVFGVAAEVGTRGYSRICAWLFATASSFLWVLLVRSVSLPGASDALNYFLTTDWNQLTNINAWVDAGRLVCTTFGVGMGIHLCHASHNEFSGSILPIIVIVIGVSASYAILSTVVAFSLIGFCAQMTSRRVRDMVVLEPNFILEYIPITLPYSLSFPTHFYLASFFIVVGCTAILGSISRLVNLRLCFEERYRDNFFGKPRYKWSAMALGTMVSYGMNIPLLSNVGLSWIALHRLSVYDIAQPFLILLEIVVLGWIVGAKALNEAHISCTGRHAGIHLVIMWKFLIPPYIIILLFIPTSFETYCHHTLASWTPAVGSGLVLIMIVIVGGAAVHTFVNYEGTTSTKLKLLALISPDLKQAEILKKQDGARAHFPHYLSLGGTHLRYLRPSLAQKTTLQLDEENAAGYFPISMDLLASEATPEELPSRSNVTELTKEAQLEHLPKVVSRPTHLTMDGFLVAKQKRSALKKKTLKRKSTIPPK